MKLQKIVDLARTHGLISAQEYDEAVTSLASPRRQRIERLLYDFRYELGVGVLLGEISEQLSFRFAVPSRDAQLVVLCEFRANRCALSHVADYPDLLRGDVTLKERM